MLQAGSLWAKWVNLQQAQHGSPDREGEIAAAGATVADTTLFDELFMYSCEVAELDFFSAVSLLTAWRLLEAASAGVGGMATNTIIRLQPLVCVCVSLSLSLKPPLLSSSNWPFHVPPSLQFSPASYHFALLHWQRIRAFCSWFLELCTWFLNFRI